MFDICLSIQSQLKTGVKSALFDCSLPCLVFLVVFIAGSKAFAEVPVERRGVEVRVPAFNSQSRVNDINAPVFDVETNPTLDGLLPEGTEAVEINYAENAVDQPFEKPRVKPSGELWELFNELEVLRQENLELRGLIETQANQINRLKEKQKQHYLDLDLRLKELTAGNINRALPASLDNPQNQSPGEVSTLTGTQLSATDATKQAKAQPAEGDLYQEALNSIKEKSYQKAADQLKALLAAYPKGFYALYAHYWLGEVILALPNPDLKKAVSHFKHVIEKDNNHKKAPPSYYKMGTLLDALGKPDEAKEALNHLATAFPKSNESVLAKKYLAEMENRR